MEENTSEISVRHPHLGPLATVEAGFHGDIGTRDRKNLLDPIRTIPCSQDRVISYWPGLAQHSMSGWSSRGRWRGAGVERVTPLFIYIVMWLTVQHPNLQPTGGSPWDYSQEGEAGPIIGPSLFKLTVKWDPLRDLCG